VRARFETTDAQIQARDAIDRALNADPADPSHVVALNLVPRTPAWLASLGASPMYLGLDLRGGVHFMLQVDMEAALTRRADVLAGDLRTGPREKGIRHGGIARDGQTIEVRARDAQVLEAMRNLITDQFAELQVTDASRAMTCACKPPLHPRPHAACRSRPSSRTSPPCTTASTNSAWPSR
jgi:preprotein translocase subunit SecD